MRTRATYCTLVLLALASFGKDAFGQVEIVVKLREHAEQELMQWLRSDASKVAPPQAAFADLGQGMLASRNLFREHSAGNNDGLDRIFSLSAADTATATALINNWTQRPDVEYAIPVHRYTLDRTSHAVAFTSDDTYADSLSHLTLTRITDAWSITEGHAGVRMGFVDTGVFFDHPDFEGQFWINPSEDLNGNGRWDPSDLDGIDNDGNGYPDDIRGYDFVDRTVATELGDLREADPDASEDLVPSTGPGRGHGTNIAGILGAAANNGTGIAGAAPGARLVAIRAFANDGEGEDDDVARAIVYGADLGLDVINLSFGDVYYSPLMHDAIKYAVSRGTTVVASAGNDGGDWPHYPSDYPEVISAGWLSRDGEERGYRASHGANLDVSAPASQTFTTLIPSTETLSGGQSLPDSVLYGHRSGSSLAAPVVAGAAALLRSIDQSLSPESIRGILTASATDIRESGWDQWTGAGRLNAFAALTMAYPARVEIESPELDTGLSEETVAVVGSCISPMFDSFVLSYAIGDDEPDGRWVAFHEGSEQVYRDTLAHWDLSQLADTTYMLRLEVRLKSGNSIEDRRRLYIDKTAPHISVVAWDRAISTGYHGIFAEIATDDFTSAVMRVTFDGIEHVVESDRFGREGRRHGFTWIDPLGNGGMARAKIVTINASGLQHISSERTFEIPSLPLTGVATEDRLLETPGGYLMGKSTDFDRDGLKEIVYNKYEELNLGDTVYVSEWSGTDFLPSGKIVANVFPRDVGDSDGDGLLELLTQVSAVTLLLEQPQTDELPIEVAYVDTTGISDIDNDEAAWGTLLMDLDGDGRGEILTHNRSAWRALEWDGTSYTESFRLENPTDPTEARQSELDTEANGFSLPRGLVADLNGDNRNELLVGDTDGDVMIFACEADNQCSADWSRSTLRYNAGSRFAEGDFDNDGITEFVTYSDGWRSLRTDREYESEYGVFYRFESVDEGYQLVDSLVIAGEVSNQIGLTSADIDGDGRQELVVGYPPHLYIFQPGDEWQLLYRWRDESTAEQDGIRSIFIVADDFDGDGADELVASTTAERMRLFDFSNVSDRLQPPEWRIARAASDSLVVFSWYAPGADSITIWRAWPDEDFDPLMTIIGQDSTTIATGRAAAYSLRAWSSGTASPFSVSRHVRPHNPGILADVAVDENNWITLRFTEPLGTEIRGHQFRLGSGPYAGTLTLAEAGKQIALQFPGRPLGPDTLFWTSLVDIENVPIEDGWTTIDFPSRGVTPLALVSWSALDLSTAVLRFNKSLENSSAQDPENYRVEPAGSVGRVSWSASQPDEVVLSINGRVLGATGKPTTLVVTNVRGEDGSELGGEGFVATFATSAENLDDVFVYPNPVNVSIHGEEAVIAGLPMESEISIYGLNGVFIRNLLETDGNGGVEWDLRDSSGAPVPSGVYLIRVEYGTTSPVLKKLALIR